jgi:hypothetical protein
MSFNEKRARRNVMRKTMLLGAALLAVAGMLTVVNVTRGQCGGGACWTYKECDAYQYQPSCSDYYKTNISDLAFHSQPSGWWSVTSGRSTILRWSCSNGNLETDAEDKDCDDNDTEQLCFDGGTYETTDLGGQITWFGPGYSICP